MHISIHCHGAYTWIKYMSSCETYMETCMQVCNACWLELSLCIYSSWLCWVNLTNVPLTKAETSVFQQIVTWNGCSTSKIVLPGFICSQHWQEDVCHSLYCTLFAALYWYGLSGAYWCTVHKLPFEADVCIFVWRLEKSSGDLQVHVHVQHSRSCLFAASAAGKLEVVKHLYKTGGSTLLMQLDMVRALTHGSELCMVVANTHVIVIWCMFLCVMFHNRKREIHMQTGYMHTIPQVEYKAWGCMCLSNWVIQLRHTRLNFELNIYMTTPAIWPWIQKIICSHVITIVYVCIYIYRVHIWWHVLSRRGSPVCMQPLEMGTWMCSFIWLMLVARSCGCWETTWVFLLSQWIMAYRQLVVFLNIR